MRAGGTRYDRAMKEREQKATAMLIRGILSASDIAVSCGLTVRAVERLRFELQSRAALAGRNVG